MARLCFEKACIQADEKQIVRCQINLDSLVNLQFFSVIRTISILVINTVLIGIGNLYSSRVRRIKQPSLRVEIGNGFTNN